MHCPKFSTIYLISLWDHHVHNPDLANVNGNALAAQVRGPGHGPRGMAWEQAVHYIRINQPEDKHNVLDGISRGPILSTMCRIFVVSSVQDTKV